MNKTFDELLEILNSGDRNKISFHIRNDFDRFHKEFPFLHNTISVSSAVEKILTEMNDEDLIKYAIQKNQSDKYKKRNYSLILADLYLENNNKIGLESIIKNNLDDEFKFLGYRKLLVYYSRNYNVEEFLKTFKKIEKRNTLTPTDRDAINTFIEKYSSECKDISQVKELVRKKRIYPKTELFITHMLLGYFGDRQNFEEIEKIVFEEFDTDYNRYWYTEQIFNVLYERSNNLDYKTKLLNQLVHLCARIPKEIKVIGYPSKMWSLMLWRVGCKYLDLDEKAKVEQIIAELKGVNKDSLKEMYVEKYKD